MLKKLTTAAMLVSFVTIAAGCGTGGDSRIISIHLVDHLKKNRLDGRYRRVDARKIGAVQGGRYVSRDRDDPFLLEFAKFDDARKAQRMAKRGFRSPDSGTVYPVYNHGLYVMIVRTPSRKRNVVKIFRKF